MLLESNESLLESEAQQANQHIDSFDRMMATETQIKNLWGEITNCRLDQTMSVPIKIWELVRLMEVHNKLDIECQRQYESDLKSLVESLQMEQIGGNVAITGGTKCYVNNKSSLASTTRSKSCAIFAPHIDNTAQRVNQVNEQELEIIRKRKSEITLTLISLNKRKHLTPEQEQIKANLMDELKGLQYRLQNPRVDHD